MVSTMAPYEAIAPFFWDMANAATEIYLSRSGRFIRLHTTTLFGGKPKLANPRA